ncbi:MAG: TIGR03905 family TSCPD domain-containing protein [Treponemataceae bacterium]
MKYTFKSRGTCAVEISFDLEKEADGKAIVKDVNFVGGCSGNTKGIASLVEGMNAQDVIERCKGIKCGMRSTSCPDQLSRALTDAIEKV